MSNLPEGWASSVLQDLIGRGGVFSDGDWIESKDQDPEGQFRLLQLADVGDGKFLDRSNRFVNDETFELLRCTELQRGDVLIARMPDPLGRACLLPQLHQRCITVVDVAIVRPGPHSVDNKWLMHWINSPVIRQWIDLEATGTTRRRIARGKLAILDLPIPPMHEQKRIANKLDRLLSQVDSCRERLDRVPAILRRFRQSVLAAATTGKLTEDWRLENSKRCEYRSLQFDVDSFDIPKNWNVYPLGDLVDPLRPLCYGVVQPGQEAEGGIPLIRVQDLDAGTVRIDDLRTVTEAIDKQYSRSRVRPGDLLISVVGTIGRTAIVPKGFEGNIARAIARVTCRAGLDSRWVNYWLNCNTLQWWLTKSSKEVARKTLNLGDLATAVIAVPPDDEQKEIVRRVGELFAISDNLDKRTAYGQALVEKLGPSMLSKAFRGELVTQNPDDEPASVLLERIREQRATSSTNTPKRSAKRTTRAARKKAAMTKSRFDDDVQGKPYLAGFLKDSKKSLSAEDLFKKADLPLVDFYKQLDFEVKQKLIVDRGGQLEAA